MNYANKNGGGRDSYVDFLRALGLLCLIAVHTYPPLLIKVFRSFDVPLMVFVSALCYKNVNNSYGEYLIKRIKRIYIPVAVFLSLYFALFGLSYLFLGKPILHWQNVAGSYLLLNSPSIGYVWIMRVFLLIAITLPLIAPKMREISYIGTIITLAVLFAVSEALASYLTDKTGIVSALIGAILPYLSGYMIFAVFGLKARSMTRSNLLTTATIALIGTLALIMINDQHVFSPSNFKYPPCNIFLTYGLFACALLWLMKPLIPGKIASSKACLFLSENSMWLYLWHILALQFAAPLGIGEKLWIVRFILVLSLSVIFTLIYKRFVSFLPAKTAKLIG